MAFFKKNWRTMRQDSKRRDKDYLPKFEVNISDVTFEVNRLNIDSSGRALPGQKRIGQMRLSYTTMDRDREKRSGEVELRLPLISVWMSPSDGEVVKAHLTIFESYVTDIDANWLEAAMFYRAVLKAGQATVNREQMTVIASSQMVLRYGRQPGKQYQTTDSTDGEYSHRYYYDTKAFAVAAIIKRIKDKQMKNVGGVSIASFNEVPDDLLIQFGFTKIPDIMGRGLPMWAGEPEIFKDAERDAYSTSGKTRLNEQLEIFLGGLQRALVS